MLLIWQKDITQKSSFYILLNLSVIYAEGASFRFEEILKEAKDQERKTDIEEIKKCLQESCKKPENQIGPPCVELVSKILFSLGHPVGEILKAADEEGCDATVLGTHGKGF
jgi:nucleotide-binding universal stress UspA family protein